jgi:hypothetical protein
MIGQTTFKNIGTKITQTSKNAAKVFTDKERRANVKLAFRHYTRKETQKATGYGAAVGTGGSIIGGLIPNRNGARDSVGDVLGRIPLLSAISAGLTNAAGAGYRVTRTFFRNPTSEKTMTQMARWQRDLDEAGPSLTSRAKKQAVNLKNQAVKLKNKLFKRESK